MGNLTHTVSGDIASFRSAARVPIESLKCHFKPIQEGTGDPSPENVRSIVGWDEVEIRHYGKNLFDANNIASISVDAWCNSTTKKISASNGDKTLYIPCLPNTVYTISKTVGDVLAGGYTTVMPETGIDLFDYYRDHSARQITITTGSDAKYIAIWYYDKSKTHDRTMTPEDVYRTLQIEYGSTATSYESYRSKTVNYEFGVLGKNKFNPQSAISDGYATSASNYTIINDLIRYDVPLKYDSLAWCNSQYLDLIPNQTYTATIIYVSEYQQRSNDYTGDILRINCKKSDGSTALIVAKTVSNRTGDTCSVTFTVPEYSTGIRISKILGYPITAGDYYEWKVQLELGSTATAYEPYDPNKTVYGGWVDVVSGEVQEDGIDGYPYCSIVLDGTEEWTLVKQDDEASIFKYYYGVPAKVESNSICSHFKMILPSYTALSCHNGFVHGMSGNLFIQPTISTASTVEEFKSYLASQYQNGTPVTILFQAKKTPNTYHLVPPIQLQTFLNQNNIWSNTNDITEVSYAIHDSAPIRAAKQRIAAFNARKIADLKNILKSNYLPNGATWVDEVDIDFDAGDYIEASINVSGCTGVNENILSIGSVIDTWAVANSPSHVSGTEDIVIHFYYPSTSGGTQLANDLTYTAVTDGTESKHSVNLNKITLSDTTLVIKVDKNNVYVNGTGIITGNLVYTALTILQAKTHLLIGSLEGSNRSHATYNYIKVVRGQ